MDDVMYMLQAVHLPGLEPIVAIRLSTEEAEAIKLKLWRHVAFWQAPGGSSVAIDDEYEATTISEMLKDRYISLAPGKHRWIFVVSPA